MTITKDTVKKISKLSRIASNEKFEENMIKDLNSILKFVEQLNEVKIENVEPLASTVDQELIKRNDKVLIIDDLIATGGTAEAAAKLVEISGGNVACFVFVINLFDLNGSDNLIKKGYKVENLIEFPGH